MNKESKLAFFRQSGWLVIATGICGVFLMFVYPLLKNVVNVSTFFTMLRFFTVLGIVTSGLQVVMAQEAARALTPELQLQLQLTARCLARGIFLFWVAMVVVCLLFKEWLLQTLKIPSSATLAITLGLVLAQLFLPFVQGLLQGTQKFAPLGWSIMLNGVGRFVGIFVFLRLFKTNATTALAGALFGLGSAVLLGAWPSRRLIFSGMKGRFDWFRWLAAALPLSAGAGSIVFLMNADVIFVQAHSTRAEYYSAVAIVGVGLVTFTTPMASVMFPKLVRSVAQSQRSDSLFLAASGTAALGLLGALLCTIFPALPLRIMFYNRPELWGGAELVPAFMWSMLPLTMGNLLVGNLLARRDFRAVPWLVAIAAAYGFELNRYLGGVSTVDADSFAAFRGVVFRLGVFSSMMLLVAFIYSLLPRSARHCE